MVMTSSSAGFIASSTRRAAAELRFLSDATKLSFYDFVKMECSCHFDFEGRYGSPAACAVSHSTAATDDADQPPLEPVRIDQISIRPDILVQRAGRPLVGMEFGMPAYLDVVLVNIAALSG